MTAPSDRPRTADEIARSIFRPFISLIRLTGVEDLVPDGSVKLQWPPAAVMS
jgi:hypothetical protein